MLQVLNKAAGILIQDQSLLVLRSHGKDIFFAPGGKLEPRETSRQALVRELSEEISIDVDESEMSFWATFTAPAAGMKDCTLCMDVFLVSSYLGMIVPSNEIAELRWINTENIDSAKIGSIFRNKVFPLLYSDGYLR